jgi:D-alanyl-D-alanine carboxypeptidase (penicillin-binding protein 5/6)
MKKYVLLIAVFAILAQLLSCAAADLVMESEPGADDAVFAEETVPAAAGEISVAAPSAILMEKESGQIIYEKNADVSYEPASVTKVMTILLIVEAVEDGRLNLDETVTVSAYASSMGGSQVFLEEGERMSARDMLKCIVVSSANDAAVAMAEHLCGSEEVFVQKMNERAGQLGMKNTLFKNCTGLLDDSEHVTTARDVAIMSRELIRHDWIKEFSTIWMDTIRGGEFGLSSTNKLIYYYDGATGLKTGFTSRAGYCLSATAERGGTEYIAVVMHCETSAARFESAKSLLSYAFSNFALIDSSPDAALPPVRVKLGRAPYIQPMVEAKKMLIEKSRASSVTKTVELEDDIEAPVSQGQEIGLLTIRSGDEMIAVVPITAQEDSPRLTWGEIFASLVKKMFFGTADI